MSDFFAPFMRQAVALAERGRWAVCPNPTVGAVLVRQGQVVAEGWHKAYGQAHAEVECLRDAAAKGVDPSECTLVVTLEPCSHHGKTPPCTAAILEAGIKHVVVGMRDPNPEAAKGIEFLTAQGVRVVCGVEEALCHDLVADYLTLLTTELPYVILKMAATLDGRIGTRTGHSRWVSGEASRHSVHALREGLALCGGAVFIGGGTLRADNPKLTVRYQDHAYDGPQPLACVLTSRLPAVGSSVYLVQERPNHTIFLTPPATAASPVAQSLRERGVRVWSVESSMDPGPGGRSPDMHALLCRLRQELNCPYILCEGGGKLALSLLNAGLVHEFRLHLNPCVLGDNASRPLFDGRSPAQMDEALPLRIVAHEMCGSDLHITLRPR